MLFVFYNKHRVTVSSTNTNTERLWGFMTQEKKKEVTSSVCDVRDKSQIRSKSEFPLCFQPLTTQHWLSSRDTLWVERLISTLCCCSSFALVHTKCHRQVLNVHSQLAELGVLMCAYLIDPLNNTGSCRMMESRDLSVCRGSLEMSIPSMTILPDTRKQIKQNQLQPQQDITERCTISTTMVLTRLSREVTVAVATSTHFWHTSSHPDTFSSQSWQLMFSG